VDVVVNRLVAHIAFGTSGCVHAVAGASGRRSSPGMYNAIARLRRAWWWHPEIRWCPEGTDPGKICALSKLYKMVGCSYLFREENTERVWQLMSPAMRETWPLWATRDPSDMSDFAVRGQTSGKMLTAWLGKKYGRPGRWVARAMGPKSYDQIWLGAHMSKDSSASLEHYVCRPGCFTGHARFISGMHLTKTSRPASRLHLDVSSHGCSNNLAVWPRPHDCYQAVSLLD
jgi:hypothetical protein